MRRFPVWRIVCYYCNRWNSKWCAGQELTQKRYGSSRYGTKYYSIGGSGVVRTSGYRIEVYELG